MAIGIKCLGQSGVRLQFGSKVFYIDPYLSENVAKMEGSAMRRLVPIPVKPENVKDAHCVLITHGHLDHCDLATILPLLEASPSATIICPNEVVNKLECEGVSSTRIILANEEWMEFGGGLRVIAVPAAHEKIERDDEGFLRYVGYVIEYRGRRVYHAGDTMPSDVLLRRLESLRPIHVALLPVNERNYYKERRGIVGNMSLREAFQMARDIKVEILVPIHWDMFAPNRVYREEIELLYKLVGPPFRLELFPKEI